MTWKILRDKKQTVLFFNRFIVRDFVYDEQALEAGKNQITKLETTKKKQFVSSAQFWQRMNTMILSCQEGIGLWEYIIFYSH